MPIVLSFCLSRLYTEELNFSFNFNTFTFTQPNVNWMVIKRWKIIDCLVIIILSGTPFKTINAWYVFSFLWLVHLIFRTFVRFDSYVYIRNDVAGLLLPHLYIDPFARIYTQFTILPKRLLLQWYLLILIMHSFTNVDEKLKIIQISTFTIQGV